MEPINYRRAIRRRWLLIVACGIVVAVVAVLVPVHAANTKTTFQVQALAGVPPTSKSGSSVQSSSLSQMKYFAEEEQLYQGLAKTLGKSYGSASGLRKDVTLKSKKGLPGGSIEVLAKQDTKDKAVKLANTFVKQLAIYADQQLASQYNKAIQNANAQVSSLGAQITSITPRSRP